MVDATSTLPVTAIVTAYRRVDDLLKTIRILRNCEPAPAEVLVHVDAGLQDTVAAVRREFPDLTVLVSAQQVGPGGGRNRLVAEAAHDIIASFDDDSYPIDRDYFERVRQTFAQFPEAWVVDSRVYHLNQAIEADAKDSKWVADFSGGGCA